MSRIPDEPVLARLHRHARVLLVPCLILIGAAAVAGYSFRGMRDPEYWTGWLPVAIAAGVLFGLLPIIAWLRHRIVITTGSTTVVKGLLVGRPTTLPHHLVAQVDTRRNGWQAIFGSGNVILTAVDGRRLELHDVPNMVTVAQALRELTGN